MKVKVNEDACISCGACTAICEEVFEFNDEGISIAKVNEVPKELEDKVTEASESCPTGAIETKASKSN